MAAFTATNLKSFAAGPDHLPLVSACSTRSASSLSCASSRPSSSVSTLSLPRMELPPVRLDRPMSRSSSSSELQSIRRERPISRSSSSAELPALATSLERDSSQKIVRRSVNGAAGKGLVRRRTWPEYDEKGHAVVKAGRSRSLSTMRVKACKKEAPGAEAQSQAIKALVLQLASKKSFHDVMHTVCRHVMKHDGTRAFSEDHVGQSVYFVQSGGDGRGIVAPQSHQCDSSSTSAPRESKSSIGPLALRVLNVLAHDADLAFVELVGQILWHFRKADALNDRLMRMTAKDLTWVDLNLAAMDQTLSAKPNELVEHVFNQHANEDGRLDERAFLKIMDRSFQEYMVQENGVTKFTGSKASCRRSDLDQLYFAQAHQRGGRGINCDGFKSVLVKLAENMSVHPTLVFVTVGGLGQ